VNLKLTPAQAVRLWRLLGEASTGTYGDTMTDDLNHADISGVWEQLDDQMVERGIPRQSYAEMVEEAAAPAALRHKERASKQVGCGLPAAGDTGGGKFAGSSPY
jgi:hypothetical protein